MDALRFAGVRRSFHIIWIPWNFIARDKGCPSAGTGSHTFLLYANSPMTASQIPADPSSGRIFMVFPPTFPYFLPETIFPVKSPQAGYTVYSASTATLTI